MEPTNIFNDREAVEILTQISEFSSRVGTQILEIYEYSSPTNLWFDEYPLFTKTVVVPFFVILITTIVGVASLVYHQYRFEKKREFIEFLFANQIERVRILIREEIGTDAQMTNFQHSLLLEIQELRKVISEQTQRIIDSQSKISLKKIQVRMS